MKRNERIAVMTKILSDRPNERLNLSYFAERFDASKTSISEDIDIIRRGIEEAEIGRIEGFAGASGGIRMIPTLSAAERKELRDEVCTLMSQTERQMAGGLVYLSDILYDPRLSHQIGVLLADHFGRLEIPIDVVLTIETKGIPIAMMTARHLNVPLVIARHDNIATEGSKISINYVSGSKGTLKTMYLSKKAIRPDSNVLIIDDFMRAGGTAFGMQNIVSELGGRVAGTGVVFDLNPHHHKVVDEYVSLFEICDAPQFSVSPSSKVKW
ncbi:MAG: pur operon repressor [Bacillota bacterium]|nr:pur operon repressor [Bacillota bacterium]